MPRINLKDHKVDFAHKPTIRLINPSRSDVGRISKKILDRVIPVLRGKTSLYQWINTDSVIDWFKGIEEKRKMKCIQFDISNYYPAISPTMLNKSLLFAMAKADMKRCEVDVILNARRTVMKF